MSRKISAIALLAILSSGGSAIAQITPDETLGDERSRVKSLNSTLDLIEGGARRGVHLFHSFEAFNVGEGQSVYFTSPSADIQNILARVTGGSRSEILGRLGTARRIGDDLFASNANLFLINPNGIVFGLNASLDVDRSFTATTASGIQIGDATFSATNPQAVTDVLQVNPSAFLFNQVPARDIVVRSNASTNPRSSFLGLEVPNGQNLTLLGGDVNIEGGQLNAFGGRVEIGAIAGVGEVGLNSNGSLSVPENVRRADVLFNNAAQVDVSFRDKGDVGITANNISLAGQSRILAGIDDARGTAESQAGDLTIDATGMVNVSGSSRIRNVVNPGFTGNSGNLEIVADSLAVTGGSQISSSTFGEGDAGGVTIEVRGRILLDGTTPDGEFNSAIFSTVEQGGKGKGGNLFITANTLDVSNGAQFLASTRGGGDAGNVTVEVRDRISLSGSTPNGEFSSAIFSDVEQNATGRGGDLFITANTLDVSNGARLDASTFGEGDAGNVTVKVRDRVSLSGSTPDGGFSSGIFSTVRGANKGGNLFITANTLDLSNGARLDASTFGEGDAGNVTVEVRDQISLSGNQTLILSSVVGQDATGKGGNLFITANTLDVSNGARLSASTFGKGDAGGITVIARDRVLFSGTTPDGRLISAIFTSVEQNATGKGGSLFIAANTLDLSNGAQFFAGTRGEGGAGNITIEVRDRMSLRGSTPDGRFSSGVFSTVQQNATGRGGDLFITANTLDVSNGGRIDASTRGEGNAGNIFLGKDDQPIPSVLISGRDTVGFSSSLSTSTSLDRSGGNIRIFVDRFRLSDGAVVDARTFATGNSGTISLNANLVEILRGGQFLAVTQGRGSSGQITIAANQLRISGTDPTFEQRRTDFTTRVAPISPESGIFTRSIGSGSAGSIFVTGSQIQLDDRARIDAQSATVDGGNISIRAFDRLVLRNNSQISATAGTAQAPGNGGNIDISTRFLIAIPKENSDIAANAFQGSGGNVTISTQGGILGFESRTRSTPLSDITASSEVGISGTVTLNAPDTNNLQNSLAELSQSAIDTNSLLANSCIVRNQQNGSFYITGTGGLPINPGELSTFSTGTIQPTTVWKPGDAIVEPQGVYQLPNGQLVMSRECD